MGVVSAAAAGLDVRRHSPARLPERRSRHADLAAAGTGRGSTRRLSTLARTSGDKRPGAAQASAAHSTLLSRDRGPVWPASAVARERLASNCRSNTPRVGLVSCRRRSTQLEVRDQ